MNTKSVILRYVLNHTPLFWKAVTSIRHKTYRHTLETRKKYATPKRLHTSTRQLGATTSLTSVLIAALECMAPAAQPTTSKREFIQLSFSRTDVPLNNLCVHKIWHILTFTQAWNFEILKTTALPKDECAHNTRHIDSSPHIVWTVLRKHAQYPAS
jgi:hypothetical protein